MIFIRHRTDHHLDDPECFFDWNKRWIFFDALLCRGVCSANCQHRIEALAHVEQIETLLQAQFCLKKKFFSALRKVINVLKSFAEIYFKLIKSLLIFGDEYIYCFT